MSGLGTAPFGTNLGPMGGPGLVTVLGVVATATTAVVVVFDRPMKRTSPYLRRSASHKDAYRVEGGPLPALATLLDDPHQVEVAFDGALSDGSVLEVLGVLEGARGETLAGTRLWALAVPRLDARTPPMTTRLSSGMDFASTPDGALAQVGNVIPRRSGAAALRARLLRRFSTRPGEWAGLPGYGGAVAAKSRVVDADALAILLREQAVQEPEVLDATVVVSPGEDGVLVVRVAVRTVAGYDRFALEVPNV